jgi:hypothetical protein
MHLVHALQATAGALVARKYPCDRDGCHEEFDTEGELSAHVEGHKLDRGNETVRYSCKHWRNWLRGVN